MFESANWCIIVIWEDRWKYNLMCQHSIFTAFFVLFKKKEKVSDHMVFKTNITEHFQIPNQNLFYTGWQIHYKLLHEFPTIYLHLVIYDNGAIGTTHIMLSYQHTTNAVWNQNHFRCSTVWQFQCIFQSKCICGC